MNTRVSNLHQHRLVTTIKGLEEDVVELKTGTQFTGGSSVVYTISKNAGAYDWSGLVNNVTWTQGFIVTITGAPGTVLYGNVQTNLSLNGFATTYTAVNQLSERLAYQNGTSTNVSFETNVYTVPNSSGQGANVNQVEVMLYGDPNRTIYLKLSAGALQPVTIAVTAL